MVTVTNLPPKNIILTYDELVLQNGILTNAEFGESLINFSNLGGRWSDYPTTRFSDIGGKTVLKLAKNLAGEYEPAGKYLCATVDAGQIITANISCRFVSTVLLRGVGSATLQIRTSKDGETWTDWQDFRPAQHTFRYLDRKVLLSTADITKTPEVNQLSVNIDVPDTELTGNISVPASGVSIIYAKAFYTVPIVTPTAIGENVFPQITAKSITGFTIKIVDRAGVSVGGELDWRAKGY
jgi:hypothetical protein